MSPNKPRSSRETALIACTALLLLVPCVWQPHIAAGDLASHSYNAWLAEQIRTGSVEGLTLVTRRTNVLLDWALDFLVNRWGRAWAEAIVVGVSVQTFFWGAFCFARRVSNSRPWIIAPSLAMLAYGLMFHFGFLNFYLATGLSVWILYLLWRPSPRGWAISVPVAVLAALAHTVPIAWAAGALAYKHVFTRAPVRARAYLLAGGIVAVLGSRLVLDQMFSTNWDWDQISGIEGMAGTTGLEQVWLHGRKYLIVMAALAVIWGILFMERMDRGEVMGDAVVHLWILTLTAFLIMPKSIQFAKAEYALLFVPQRISLFTGILFCAMAAGSRYGRRLTLASIAAAALYFAMVFFDARAINRVEARVASLVTKLPPGQRVVAAMRDTASDRLNGVVHVGAGACLGHCYDYANYEPATGGLFRVKANGPNPYNTWNMDLVYEFEHGMHVVTAEEAPIHSVCSEGSGLVLRKLDAGDTTCWAQLPVTPQIQPQRSAADAW